MMNRNALVLMAALATGVIFGLGLMISQMINPAKVMGFLDLAGDWDPSLILVMGSAMAVTTLGVMIGKRRHQPALVPHFSHPTTKIIDLRLVAGAAIFGIGWGLAGFCPGPALMNLVYGGAAAAMFVSAMLAGMFIFNVAQAHFLHRG